MTKCSYIDDYISAIRNGEVPASKELRQAMDYIEGKLSAPDVFIDVAKIEKAKELIERYFAITLFDWELFVLALVHCYYQSDDTVVFSEFLIVMGRGNGKNAFISGLSWYLTTKYHGIAGYNVDIIANSEDQAKTSFEDIYDMLERTWNKSKHFFYKSKVLIKNLNTKSYIKYNASHSSTNDGKRSACLIFDELHEYKNSDNIKVFRSGFGKRKHCRIFNITTQGYVRDGVLDDKLRIAHDVLNGEIKDSRLCPLIYKMNTEAECYDESLWEMANPSIRYLPTLLLELRQNLIDLRYDESVKQDFFTKRMNLPRVNQEIAVTDWSNISATCNPLPDLAGSICVAGIDFSKLNDWASVNLHFRRGQKRYDISHSFVCTQSPDLPRIKAPWWEWQEVEAVNDVEISPERIVQYLVTMAQRYCIVAVAVDNFRFALLRKTLETIGFSVEAKTLRLIRPSDIMRIQPVINSCFLNHYFTWGDCPSLRWATNNTMLVRSGRVQGTDTGNYYYAKIEGKSRKTDPFMALVASMVIEDELPEESIASDMILLDVIT